MVPLVLVRRGARLWHLSHISANGSLHEKKSAVWLWKVKKLWINHLDTSFTHTHMGVLFGKLPLEHAAWSTCCFLSVRLVPFSLFLSSVFSSSVPSCSMFFGSKKKEGMESSGLNYSFSSSSLAESCANFGGGWNKQHLGRISCLSALGQCGNKCSMVGNPFVFYLDRIEVDVKPHSFLLL